MRSISRATSRCAIVGVAAILSFAPTLIAGPLARAAAPEHLELAAEFSGTFELAGNDDRSPILTVGEVGAGAEGSLGDFSYTVTVQQNDARPPASCPTPNSSTAAGGTATMVLTDGTLSLTRRSGDACFAFPTVHGIEQWFVSKGTDRYRGASGALTREFDADVRFGTLTGTWTGSLVLPSDR